MESVRARDRAFDVQPDEVATLSGLTLRRCVLANQPATG